MGELGQAPRPAESGRFLQKETVGGNRVNFVAPSSYANSVLTLAATGSATNLDFGSFSVNFTYSIDGQVYPWESIIAWNYSNFYVDGTAIDENNLYRYGTNVSGSSAALRKTMNIDIFGHNLYLPILPSYFSNTHSWVWFMKNNDSSSHIMGLATISKYIVTGGPNG